MFFKKIFGFILGNSTRNLYIGQIAATLLLHFSFLLVSYLLYPEYPYNPSIGNYNYAGGGPVPPMGPYNPYYNQISHLGSPSLNPAGYIYFNAAMVILAVGLIPAVFKIYRIYSRYMRITSGIYLMSSAVSVIGLLLLPMYSVDDWTPHYTVASVIFSSFIFTFSILGYIWAVKIRKITSDGVIDAQYIDKRVYFLGIINASMLVLVCLFVYYLNTLWEWIFYVAIIIYLPAILILTPEK